MLFDDLWPAMNYAQEHKKNCLDKILSIQTCFKKFGTNHNTLLNNLTTIDGIGLTIASGLIWAAFPENRVPFDKYTLTYALTVETVFGQGIIKTHKISTNYVTYSDKIKAYCDGFAMGEEPYEIEDFVREAMVEMMNYPALIGPI